MLAPAVLGRWRALIFMLALAPLARLIWLAATQGLGANPVEFVVRSLGLWALVILCALLALTPLRWLTGAQGWSRPRRMLGLFSYFYATLHLAAYAGLDQWFDFAAIGRDIVKRPYIALGWAAYLGLLPLAVTSTHAMQRRLGGRRWRMLHRAVYLIAPLAAAHFLWQRAAKNDWTEPLIYAAAIAVLLGARVLRKRGQGNTDSPANSDATVSRARTQCAVSPSTRTSAARGREL
jgi:sulfoxide reductase heme-binding subunit YedZ